MPRRTLRTQLTLLYAGPFFVSGVLLLALPILQTKNTVPAGSQGGAGTAHLQDADVHLHRVLAVSAVGLAVMVVVSIVLGWLIAGRFLRPLRTITATARHISASNLHRRLGRTGRNNEFTELAETLDDLFERLEAAFDSQRHFVANASHELRTPLTAERTLLQVALADPDATAETLRSTCQDVLALGKQQEGLIEALLTLASSEQGVEQRESFDLADIAGAVVLARHREAQRRGIQVEAALAPAPAMGDPSLVASLTANLVDNALRHNTAGGRVDIATTTTAGRARLTVRNTGTMIPPDQVDRLFQPFQQLGSERLGSQRLRSQRMGHTDGHGLGLAIVGAIANAHGATLTPQARPDGGLDIAVDFPDPGIGAAAPVISRPAGRRGQ
jgi:signal transduction histidine kinase